MTVPTTGASVRQLLLDAYPRRMTDPADRGPVFDGIRIGRAAAGALLDAGYLTLPDLPTDLDALLALHGVGPKAVRLLREAQEK